MLTDAMGEARGASIAGSISSRSACHPSDSAPPSYRLSKHTLNVTAIPAVSRYHVSAASRSESSSDVQSLTTEDAYPAVVALLYRIPPSP
jgi:hypothetical protein